MRRSPPASVMRTCGWSPGGKRSIRRSIVFAALGVFIVPSTRCPVSLAASAMRTVSVSRSSPTTMTSGILAQRRLERARERRACACPTSRWLIIARLRGCRYSTGSSTVMTWWVVSRLMMSTIAASVLVLPWPVGPVTTTSPWWWCVARSISGGRPSEASVGTSAGMQPEARP